MTFDDWLTDEASRRHVVLVVDDVQWPDPQTLDVLMYVLAGPAGRALAVLLTERSSEVGAEHPLRRWLADVRRLPGVEEVGLGPLSREAMGEQVAQVMGGPAHTSLVDEVYARSSGNPYFAQLLVAGLELSETTLPAHLPEELSSAAVRGWTELSDDARRLAVSLAVAGGPVSRRALERVADVADLDDPAAALREARDAGLLEHGRTGSWWFRHPLQAEALEQGLPAESRRVLHAGFASGYAEDVEDGLTPELAETVSDHHLLAGHPSEAYEWALTAADAMDQEGSLPGALRMLRRAADLRPEVDDAASSHISNILRKTGTANRVELAAWATRTGPRH